MKKSFLFLCLCILALAGCKKESKELNRNAVSILVLPITDNGVSPFGYSYKLKAMVVAPGKVEVDDYGFLVTGGGTTSITPVPLGSGDIGGGIEANYDSPLPMGQFTVAAYALLKNGEMIYSEGYTPPASPTGTIQITYANYDPSYEGIGKATFVGTITSPSAGQYIITEIGIDYATDVDYTSLGNTYNMHQSQPSSSSAASTPISLQYNIDGIDFYGKANYHYRLYANILEVATTNTFTISSGDLTFSTP